MSSRNRQTKAAGHFPRTPVTNRARLGSGPSRVSRPPYLFHHWSRMALRLGAARHIVLFLDFDGTLVPLQDDPERVTLPESTRRALRRLVRRMPVYVISGRRRADVWKRVDVAGVTCLGLHGWEGVRPRKKNRKRRRLVDRARRQIEQRLQHPPEIRIEDKGPIFAVHYRGASPNTVRRAKAAVEDVLKPLKSDLRVRTSKGVWEIVPKSFKDKGATVRKLVQASPAGTLAVYVGDDVSDETAFAALPGHLTVVVGRRSRTQARFYLRSPSEVERLLARLEDGIR